MDPLTQTLALLRPRELKWKHLQATGEWAVRFPATKGAAFGLICTGGCVLDVPGYAQTILRQGDYLLLTSPPAWTIGGTYSSVPVNFEAVYSGSDQRTTYIGRSNDNPSARLVGGHFTLDHENVQLLKTLVPAVLVIHSMEAGAERLGNVLKMIGDEALSEHPGRMLIMEKLLEVMLVEAIRHDIDIARVRIGLVAGLRDPQLSKILQAVHDDIRRRWTVEQLGSIAGMSRSVFAERFTRVIGVAPMEYVLHWRMAQAKNALRYGKSRPAQVAFDCGYQSVGAFSTAFNRVVGCPPARYGAERAVDGEASDRPI